MKIYAVSFSPTGTSSRVLEGILSGLEGVSPDPFVRIDVTHRPAGMKCLGEEDVLIVAVPVYGGKAAPLAKERMACIEGSGTRCVVVAVYGNRAFENAVADMSSFLGERGFLTVGAAAFVGEHSYSTLSAPIAAGRPDEADVADARRFGELLKLKIDGGGLRKIEAASLSDIESPETSLVRFREFVASYQRRQTESPVKYLPEVDSSVCDGCGVCVLVCPTAAISADDLAVAAEKCIKCCACVKCCPRGARRLDSPFAKPLHENFSLRKDPVWIV